MSIENRPSTRIPAITTIFHEALSSSGGNPVFGKPGDELVSVSAPRTCPPDPLPIVLPPPVDPPRTAPPPPPPPPLPLPDPPETVPDRVLVAPEFVVDPVNVPETVLLHLLFHLWSLIQCYCHLMLLQMSQRLQLQE